MRGIKRGRSRSGRFTRRETVATISHVTEELLERTGKLGPFVQRGSNFDGRLERVPTTNLPFSFSFSFFFLPLGLSDNLNPFFRDWRPSEGSKRVKYNIRIVQIVNRDSQ